MEPTTKPTTKPTTTEPTITELTNMTTTKEYQLLPPPFGDRSFATIEEAMDALNDWAATQGYAVSKKSSYKNAQGFIPTVRFQCQRSRKYQDRRVEKIRKTYHQATGCPFTGKEYPPYILNNA